MNANEQKNINDIEKDFISRLKMDMMVMKNQLQKTEADLAEKNAQLKQKDIKIAELNNDLKEALSAIKVKEREFHSRVSKLEDELQPHVQQPVSSPVIARALSSLGIKITAVE